MIIRNGTATDMKGVLALIKELAIFEKEPEAVVISEEDLIRDGFGEKPLFSVFVAEKEQEIVGIALYYYRYSTWKGKNDSFRRFGGQRKYAWDWSWFCIVLRHN